MGLLKEKRALITGGTSGLGKQIALVFALEGAHVAILGKDLPQAEEAAESIRSKTSGSNQNIWFKAIDVSQKSEVDSAMYPLLMEWGGIDILVNCAGITKDKLFLKMEESDWDQVIATNLKSVYNVTHSLVRSMVKARHGKIINISSVIGLQGNPGQVNYSASKLGIVGLTRSLAKELASRNINVNCIAPGFFKTPMTDMLTDEQKKEIIKKVPMNRLGDPQEVAHGALFLASHMSDYITGQILVIDGGMSA